MKELHREFVLAWETSTSITEVSTKMMAAGYFEFSPGWVRRYARTLRRMDVRLKRILRGLAPTLYSDDSVPAPEQTTVNEAHLEKRTTGAFASDFEFSVSLNEG